MKWYQEVLGFELVYYLEDLGWCELKSPVSGVNVGLSQVETMPPPDGNCYMLYQDIALPKAAVSA